MRPLLCVAVVLASLASLASLALNGGIAAQDAKDKKAEVIEIERIGDLYNDYSRNPVAAKKKYRDKLVKVITNLQSLKRSRTKRGYYEGFVSIYQPANEAGYVFLFKESAPGLDTVKTGFPINGATSNTIVGRVVGETDVGESNGVSLYRITITDCSIIKK